jgi:2'-5' RNA ligase
VKRQSAVFVSVPVGDAVDSFRAQYHPRAIARKLPPHITILPPFIRDLDEDETLGAELAVHFTSCDAFSGELVDVGTFRRHVWLAPAPQERFVELITVTRERFPRLIRDERDPVPHLTIAEIGKGESIRRVAELAQEEIEPLLPIRFGVEGVGLYEVQRDGWHEVRRFPLG